MKPYLQHADPVERLDALPVVITDGQFVGGDALHTSYAGQANSSLTGLKINQDLGLGGLDSQVWHETHTCGRRLSGCGNPAMKWPPIGSARLSDVQVAAEGGLEQMRDRRSHLSKSDHRNVGRRTSVRPHRTSIAANSEVAVAVHAASEISEQFVIHVADASGARG